MNQFYAGIATGEPPSTAMRYAKLALLKGRNGYSKPYYSLRSEFMSAASGDGLLRRRPICFLKYPRSDIRFFGVQPIYHWKREENLKEFFVL